MSSGSLGSSEERTWVRRGAADDVLGAADACGGTGLGMGPHQRQQATARLSLLERQRVVREQTLAMLQATQQQPHQPAPAAAIAGAGAAAAGTGGKAVLQHMPGKENAAREANGLPHRVPVAATAVGAGAAAGPDVAHMETAADDGGAAVPSRSPMLLDSRGRPWGSLPLAPSSSHGGSLGAPGMASSDASGGGGSAAAVPAAEAEASGHRPGHGDADKTGAHTTPQGGDATASGRPRAAQRDAEQQGAHAALHFGGSAASSERLWAAHDPGHVRGYAEQSGTHAMHWSGAGAAAGAGKAAGEGGYEQLPQAAKRLRLHADGFVKGGQEQREQQEMYLQQQRHCNGSPPHFLVPETQLTRSLAQDDLVLGTAPTDEHGDAPCSRGLPRSKGLPHSNSLPLPGTERVSEHLAERTPPSTSLAAQAFRGGGCSASLPRNDQQQHRLQKQQVCAFHARMLYVMLDTYLMMLLTTIG